MAWVHHLAGEMEDAISLQQSVVEKLVKIGKYPSLAVEASLRLAKWLDNESSSLEVLRNAEKVVMDQLGPQDTKTVEVKREIALLLIKRRDHEQALEYLSDVQYLEREIFGPQSRVVH